MYRSRNTLDILRLIVSLSSSLDSSSESNSRSNLAIQSRSFSFFFSVSLLYSTPSPSHSFSYSFSLSLPRSSNTRIPPPRYLRVCQLRYLTFLHFDLLSPSILSTPSPSPHSLFACNLSSLSISCRLVSSSHLVLREQRAQSTSKLSLCVVASHPVFPRSPLPSPFFSTLSFSLPTVRPSLSPTSSRSAFHSFYHAARVSLFLVLLFIDLSTEFALRIIDLNCLAFSLLLFPSHCNYLTKRVALWLGLISFVLSYTVSFLEWIAISRDNTNCPESELSIVRRKIFYLQWYHSFIFLINYRPLLSVHPVSRQRHFFPSLRIYLIICFFSPSITSSKEIG